MRTEWHERVAAENNLEEVNIGPFRPFFGLPASTRERRRAGRASWLALVDKVERLQEPDPLRGHIGIARTGQVVVGDLITSGEVKNAAS